MLNLIDAVTVTGQQTTGTDPDSGNPIRGTVTVLADERCALRVLRAEDQAQTWGDAPTTQTDAVYGNLLVQNHAAAVLTGALSGYTFTVAGYAGNWRALARRPGADTTTFLLTQ